MRSGTFCKDGLCYSFRGKCQVSHIINVNITLSLFKIITIATEQSLNMFFNNSDIIIPLSLMKGRNMYLPTQVHYWKIILLSYMHCYLFTTLNPILFFVNHLPHKNKAGTSNTRKKSFGQIIKCYLKLSNSLSHAKSCLIFTCGFN